MQVNPMIEIKYPTLSVNNDEKVEVPEMDLTNPDRITKFHSVPNDKFKSEEELIKHYGYSMGSKIAEGGFSNVFKAIHNKLQKDVACKVVDFGKKRSRDMMDSLDSSSGSEVKISDLKNEITIMNRLRNRYIVNLYTNFIVNSKLYIFMKFADSGTLFSYLKNKGQLSEAEARKLLAQLLVGTEHMHECRIAHRDLKLENILMLKKRSGTHSLTLLISDFGLSKIVSHSSSTDKAELSKTFCGTPTYMAPEIILRRPYSGYSADVYALGILLYCMLNGCFPWDQTDLKAQLKAQLLRDWDWLCTNLPSKEVDAFLKGLIEPSASKRLTLKAAIENPWIAADFSSAKHSKD